MKLCICTRKQMQFAVANPFTRLLPSGNMFMWKRLWSQDFQDEPCKILTGKQITMKLSSASSEFCGSTRSMSKMMSVSKFIANPPNRGIFRPDPSIRLNFCSNPNPCYFKTFSWYIESSVVAEKNELLNIVVLWSEQMRDFMFKKFSLQLQNIKHKGQSL